jgi:hypothetical protein
MGDEQIDFYEIRDEGLEHRPFILSIALAGLAGAQVVQGCFSLDQAVAVVHIPPRVSQVPGRRLHGLADLPVGECRVRAPDPGGHT